MLEVHRLDDGIWRPSRKAIDVVRPGNQFGLRFQMPAKENSGRPSLSENQTTPFLPVAGLGSGAYS